MILNSLPKFSLFGIDVDYKDANIICLPIPYDSTTSYQSGTRNGPREIINASRFIESYSLELNKDLSYLKIFTEDELAPNYNSPIDTINDIKKEVNAILEKKKIPLLIGGEHTITIGAILAFYELGIKDLFVVHFDAHTDSYDEFQGSKFTHATVISRVREKFDYISIGIRSIDKGSLELLNSKKIIDIDRSRDTDFVSRLINERKESNIYITFDFDVLDPSEMPSVGTPEPNGMYYREIISIMKKIKKNVIGLDFTEFMPIPNLAYPNFLAAKLIYNTLGIFF